MLGAERQIIDRYVSAGEVKLTFTPMLDHGGSLNATAAALCMGAQNPYAFWQAHDSFFENQGQIFGANRAYYVNAAAGFGLDSATFESCYDGGAEHATASTLDGQRKAAGIFTRPTIFINGQQIVGAQPFNQFAQLIDAALE